MRCVVALAAGAVTLAIALSAAAQEFKPPANLFGQQPPAPKPPKVDWRPSVDRDRPAPPTVICGMTLVPADPRVDPRMRVEAPERGVTFTMRTVPPTICKTPSSPVRQ